MYKYTFIVNEYTGKKAVMATDAPVNGHKNAQAGVTFGDGGAMDLWSYGTNIASFDGVYVTMHGYYSMTSAKHLSWWLREYFPALSYSYLKKAMLSGCMVNPATGEIKKAPHLVPVIW